MSRVSISDRPGFGGLGTLCTDEVSLYRVCAALPCGGVLPFSGKGALGNAAPGKFVLGVRLSGLPASSHFVFCFSEI